MAGRKGFTFLELIVVLVIIGILAALVLPNLFTSIEQSRAQTAQNNLMAIVAGQEKYYEDHQAYYSDGGGGVSALNAHLNLSMSTNDSFAYSCSVPGVLVPASPYSCSASDGSVTLTFNPSVVVPANPVSCTGPTGSCPANLQ